MCIRLILLLASTGHAEELKKRTDPVKKKKKWKYYWTKIRQDTERTRIKVKKENRKYLSEFLKNAIQHAKQHQNDRLHYFKQVG